MVDDDLLATVLITEPDIGVGSKEQVDGGMLGEGVKRGLSEAGNDCSLTLN